MSVQIDFEREYFQPEIRCGYPVSSTMKTVWAAQLEVLAYIAEICERHNLHFYAMFGTLLGAARHKGYIPWDDDLDIGMLREDYMGFLEVARQELPAEYQIFSVYADSNCAIALTRVVNGSRIDLAGRRIAEYHGCPFVVGIDIFPLDYVPADLQARTEQYELLHLIQNIFQHSMAYSQRVELQLDEIVVLECRKQIETGLDRLEKQYRLRVDTSQQMAQQLLLLYDMAAMMYREEESSFITSHQISCNADRMLFHKEWFAESIPMGFETVFLPAPVGWDDILRVNYGDYMQFPKNFDNHGGYEEQAEILIQQGVWKPAKDVFPVKIPRAGKLQLPEQMTEAEAIRNGYKLVLYSTSLTGMLRSGEQYLQKIRNTIEVFGRRKEVLLWWRPHETDGCLYQKLDPELFVEYEGLIQEYRSRGQGILDETDDKARAVNQCAAFYGDMGEVYDMFQKTGKPMMRQNADIFS